MSVFHTTHGYASTQREHTDIEEMHHIDTSRMYALVAHRTVLSVSRSSRLSMRDLNNDLYVGVCDA